MVTAANLTIVFLAEAVQPPVDATDLRNQLIHHFCSGRKIYTPGFDKGSLKIQVAPEVGSGQSGAKPLPPPLTGPNISGYP